MSTSGTVALAPPGAKRPIFTRLVRAEIRKLGRQRGTWAVLVGVSVIFLPLIPVLLASLGLQHHPDRFLRWAALSSTEMVSTAAGAFLLLAGARLTGLEYTGGTIRVILARGVGRVQLLAAKLAALCLVGTGVLAAFALLTGAGIFALAAAWQVGAPGATAWRAGGGAALAVLVSAAACILLSVTAGTVGRSTAFAVGVAMGFFPADNVAGILLNEAGSATHSGIPGQVAGYLLGPNLNTLPSQVAGVHGILVGQPLDVDLVHTLVVVGLWCAGLLALAVVAVRRDVAE